MQGKACCWFVFLPVLQMWFCLKCGHLPLAHIPSFDGVVPVLTGKSCWPPSNPPERDCQYRLQTTKQTQFCKLLINQFSQFWVTLNTLLSFQSKHYMCVLCCHMLPLLLLIGCVLGNAAFNLQEEREDQYLHDDSVKNSKKPGRKMTTKGMCDCRVFWVMYEVLVLLQIEQLIQNSQCQILCWNFVCHCLQMRWEVRI